MILYLIMFKSYTKYSVEDNLLEYLTSICDQILINVERIV